MPPRTQRVCHGLCTVRVCRMLCQLIGSCNPMLHPITTRFPPSGSVVCMALESCFCCPCAFCGSRYGNFDMDLASSHVLLSYVPLPPPRVTCSTPCPCLLDADWCACDRMPMRTYLSVCIPGSTCVRSTSSNMTRLRSGSATARQRRHSVLTISLAFRSSMPPRTRRVKCSAYRMPVTRCHARFTSLGLEFFDCLSDCLYCCACACYCGGCLAGALCGNVDGADECARSSKEVSGSVVDR